MNEQYPHISQGMREMMLGIGATPQQFKASDKNAKANIDSALVRYLTLTDIPKICIILVGEDGPGKEFVARALLDVDETGDHGAEGIGVTPVLTNGLEIIVVNTPGSWQMKVPQDQAEMMTFFVFVIDSKSQPVMPTGLNQFEVEKVVEAITLGRFVVANDHTDPGAKEYLEEYCPLYPLLKSDHVIRFNIGSKQNLGSTQQDIICKMLLNAENKSEETLESGWDIVNVEELASDEVHVGDEKSDKNLDSWEDLALSDISRATEIKESGEAEKEIPITRLLDELQSSIIRISVASSSATIGTVVIGATGSGKSATANTLLGENEGERFLEGSSAVSVTTESAEKSTLGNGFRLTVVDTPGSWETNHIPKEGESKVVYVFVINLASPRFDLKTQENLEKMQDTEGNCIVNSGNFVVALSHADSVLQNTTLEGYLKEIEGDPLHTFLTGDAIKGKVIALNNAAETQYQRNAHRQVLLSRVLLASSKMGPPTSKSRFGSWWPWETWIPSIPSTVSYMYSGLTQCWLRGPQEKLEPMDILHI